MESDKKKISERFRHTLNNIKNQNLKNQNQNELLSLFSSEIITKENNQNFKIGLINDILKNDNNKKTENSLLDKFINEKVDINKKTFYKDFNSNSYNIINKIKENNQNLNQKNFINKKSNSSFKEKYKESGTFITRMNYINKKNSVKKDEINSYKSYRQLSLNDTFIKNVKVEMIKKGILLHKPFSSKIRYRKKQLSHNKENYNNFDLHMEVFKSKIIKELNKYIKYYELSQKKKLKNVSEELAIKKELMTKSIPIYIKGYTKNGKDVFHSRKIYDIQYQNRYRKPLINFDELIQNQNVYSNNKFKNDKFPFYHFLRTVNNPFKNLKVKKNSKNHGKIFIRFDKEEENKKTN